MSSSNNPTSVKIARKRGAEDQEPPSTLIVQSRDGDANGDGAVYIRQKRRDVSIRNFGEKDHHPTGDAAFAPPSGPKNELTRRLFEFKRKTQPDGAATGKRGRDDVATFVEQRTNKSWRSASPGAREDNGQDVPRYAAVPERAFKRPSRQPRARTEEGGEEAARPQTEAQRREMESLARYLHEAALEEVRHEARPAAKVTPPKISGQRARELHRRRVESNAQLAARQQPPRRPPPPDDTDMSDGDYIYDTYVLAPAHTSTDFAALPAHSSDVGYLVISPSDQDAWATYLDDRSPASEDEGRRSDDEDENAEDYYGADYPEDELSSDDEFGRPGLYDRDGEGEESDGAAWSDGEDEEEGEVERMMNPFAWRGPRLAGVRRRLDGEEGGVV